MSQQQAVPAVLDRTERSGSPLLLLVLTIVMLGAITTLAFVPRQLGNQLTLALLAVLAAAGVLGLCAYAIGYLQLSTRTARNDITKLIADSGSEGLLVTEGDTRVLYANSAYLALSGGQDPANLRTVERLFSGTPEVSEAVYRLSQAAREGKRGSEELRLSPPLNGDGQVGWYRIRVRPLERFGHKRAALWSVADITRERDRHENVFQELQHAIDFLDHAPAGFFSADPGGQISYMNATLANWLDYDLAQVGTGGLAVSDVIAGDGSALLSTLTGAPGEVLTRQFDVDLKRRSGQNLPARLIHRIAFAQDQSPGPSRTLVINRAPGEEPGEDLRAAEVRFARFYNQTPVAIAALDKDGRITDPNAAFASLMPEALKGRPGDAGHTIFAGVAERDHEALRAALVAADQDRSDIPPIDVTLADGRAEPGAGDASEPEGEDNRRSARLFIAPAEGSGAATVFALDTTEQRKLKESFAQSQKMQAVGQLAGGVAHDFNNILTAILGFSDLLIARHRPTDPSFQDIMQIRQNANRAAGLTRQLLAFSRRQTLR
ncbi:MAG: PAS domain-containing protein, partial [Beijerinckiaceae bacterium]